MFSFVFFFVLSLSELESAAGQVAAAHEHSRCAGDSVRWWRVLREILMVCFLPLSKVHCLTVRKLSFELAFTPKFWSIVAIIENCIRSLSEFAGILSFGYFLGMLLFYLSFHFLWLKEENPRYLAELVKVFLVACKATSCKDTPTPLYI